MKSLQARISGLPGTPFVGGRQQCRRFHLERLRQDDQFGIRYAAKLRFDFRECAATQFQSEHRTTRREQFLRQSLLVTQFPDLRADDVLRFDHAPIMELDLILLRGLNCSVYGATHPVKTAQRNRTSEPDSGKPCWESRSNTNHLKFFISKSHDCHLVAVDPSRKAATLPKIV